MEEWEGEGGAESEAQMSEVSSSFSLRGFRGGVVDVVRGEGLEGVGEVEGVDDMWLVVGGGRTRNRCHVLVKSSDIRVQVGRDSKNLDVC